MKFSARILSLVLALALALSCACPALALESQEETETKPLTEAVPALGEIQATLRLDYAQKRSALQNHDVKAVLLQNGRQLGALPLWETNSFSVGGYPAQVELKNADGGPDGTGWPRYATLSVSGLPPGSYTLAVWCWAEFCSAMRGE